MLFFNNDNSIKVQSSQNMKVGTYIRTLWDDPMKTVTLIRR